MQGTHPESLLPTAAMGPGSINDASTILKAEAFGFERRGSF